MAAVAALWAAVAAGPAAALVAAAGGGAVAALLAGAAVAAGPAVAAARLLVGLRHVAVDHGARALQGVHRGARKRDAAQGRRLVLADLHAHARLLLNRADALAALADDQRDGLG